MVTAVTGWFEYDIGVQQNSFYRNYLTARHRFQAQRTFSTNLVTPQRILEALGQI